VLCSVGGAAFCLDYAWQYAAERRQFGQPVGAFQASQVGGALMTLQQQAGCAGHEAFQSVLDTKLFRFLSSSSKYVGGARNPVEMD